MMPDYVFTFGMLWNFVETKRFLVPDIKAKAGAVDYSKDKGLIMGPPSEKYLPLYVREIVRQFLQAQGFSEAKVLVISSPDYREVDLVFSTQSLNNLAASQHKKMAEILGWFLPLHYRLVLADEQGLPAFYAL
jgi:hypothetical protein